MYVTVEEYKRRYLNTGLSDEDIDLGIDSVSTMVEEYCNTKFVPTADKYSLDFESKFYTRKAPLISVSNLTIHKIILDENKEFYAYPENRIVELDEDLKPPNKTKKVLSIQYTYGHEIVPTAVKEVILDLINLNDLIAKGEISSTAYQSESWDGEYTYTKASGEESTATAIRKQILSRLEPYKILDIMQLPSLDFENEKGNVRAMFL